MGRLDFFNRLPARPEYLAAVKQILKAKENMSLQQIVTSTSLSKTQAACALEKLIADGDVLVVPGASKSFSLVDVEE